MTDASRSGADGSRYAPAIAGSDVAWIAALPKVELHLHLSGSLRPRTALRLARERGVASELSDEELMARLRAPDRCADQAELLRAFQLPALLLRDSEALHTAAAELVEDIAAEGMRYAEIRFAPANLTSAGLSIRGAIESVADGVREGRRRCSEPPVVRIIAIAMRTEPGDSSLEVARIAAASMADGVSGFDLAGLEASAPSLAPHRAAFEHARAAGLGISVHAGEWGGAAQVRAALDVAPDRIAHGGPAADDAGLMAELRHRGITLDLCPTSNVQAGLVRRMAEHPLPRLYRAGVPVTVSTDDRTVSATSLSRELALAMDPLGLRRADLLALARRALEAAFLQDDETTRSRLLQELDAVSADIQEDVG